MEIRQYYQKIREVEASIGGPWLIVVSLETADGGVAGNATEVSKAMAARLIVEGKARLADPDEVKNYHERVEEARKAAEQRESAGRVNWNVISEADLRALKSGRK